MLRTSAVDFELHWAFLIELWLQRALLQFQAEAVSLLATFRVHNANGFFAILQILWLRLLLFLLLRLLFGRSRTRSFEVLLYYFLDFELLL